MNKHEKLQEYIDDWNELEAYRNLSGLPFDFGTGLIEDNSTSSEDVYWKMAQWEIERAIDDLIYYQKPKLKRKHKYKANHYKRKIKNQQKLKKLSKISWWIVGYDETNNRYVRYYLSGRKGFAKYCSKRKVRNRIDFSLKGNGYRRVYDYWWMVF